MNRLIDLFAAIAFAVTLAACQTQNAPSPNTHATGAYDNQSAPAGTGTGGATTGNLGGQEGVGGGGSNAGSR